MKKLLLALFVAVLTACGGGGGAPTPPAASTPAPAASTPAPAASTPAPAASTPVSQPKPVVWREAWAEPWEHLSLGGWVRHGQLKCNGGVVDPDRPPEGAFTAGSWSLHGGVSGVMGARGGALHIDVVQHSAGFALLSGLQLPHLEPVAVEAEIHLQPDVGAWIGLTLIGDETDYRELALYTDYDVPDRTAGGVWHPCTVEWSLGRWPPGPRTLRIEYTPGGDVCWRHYVDSALVAQEACSRPGAPLTSPPRIGLYVVNLLAEGQRTPGKVRAVVGPIRVFTAQP